VLLRPPIDPRIPVRHLHPPLIGSPSQRPDPEVPLRMLIDKALTVRGYFLLPLAAPHHRRDGLVFGGPFQHKGQALAALSRRRSRQPQLVLSELVGFSATQPVKALVRSELVWLEPPPPCSWRSAHDVQSPGSQGSDAGTAGVGIVRFRRPLDVGPRCEPRRPSRPSTHQRNGRDSVSRSLEEIGQHRPQQS
jgi:hypothetical protein